MMPVKKWTILSVDVMDQDYYLSSYNITRPMLGNKDRGVN